MSQQPTNKTRIESVDALRGFVMIIMALDHTREFFHADSMLFQPESLTRTTVAIFLTRWITHICAPVFMLTAGLGAFFWLRRGRSTSELSRFLWKRGVWLMLLELTVLRLAMNFSLFSGPLALTVLWALGLSMVALGFLVRLPVRVLAVISVLVIALHNLADGVDGTKFLGSSSLIWNLLHQPGMIPVRGIVVLVGYPLVPWVAVMAAGFCLGNLMIADERTRRKGLICLGLGMTLSFVVIRFINVYGDPMPWTADVPGKTFLSFLRCMKYPPSLDFLLMTLGPALLLLAWMDSKHFSKANPLVVFGRVPLFYFLLHIFLIHALTIPFALVRYGRAGFLLNPLPSSGGPSDLFPKDYGYSLPAVYGFWILVVCLMYPMCLWFARLKQRRSDWWLSYL